MLKRREGRAVASLTMFLLGCAIAAPAQTPLPEFRHDIRPLLENYCFDCHADGANKGNVAFDTFKSDGDVLAQRDLWFRALKNVRASIMPPSRKPQPSAAEKQELALWIKRAVFQIDPANPDPGHVTLRRLNRTEYRNTIRDLLGVDFDTRTIFPPDETTYGFDNIGTALTLSPMLLEKYLLAAKTIVAQALPPSPDSSLARANYARFFPEKVANDARARKECARKALAPFARRAFRRPVDSKSIERLVSIVEQTSSQPGKTFEGGIRQALVAILASPRMLFLEDRPETSGSETYPLIDEFSLASRLSYFLWSTTPDEHLLHLAEAGKLRENLGSEIDRMLEDKRSAHFVRDFTGQWLRARDIETVDIESRAVLLREEAPDPERERNRKRFHELRDKPEAQLTEAEKRELAEIRAKFRKRYEQKPKVELDGDLRRAMRAETEKVFDYILREDRSLLELIESDYTFLNEPLAKLYGIDGVTGPEMRLVKLAKDSPRGGILTEGTILAVTANPTRTSPVKRGLFILDNVLGTPPPPPPANLPPLEDAAQGIKDHTPTLRETLALHRAKPLCASCHNRMDPLGLALENFNAMGMWRDSEFGQPIDSSAQLITGEKCSSVQQLKHVIATKHATDFFRTLTEKMLTYAIGRGLEYYDVETVDNIVAKLESSKGRPSVLIRGIIDSAPFERMRRSDLDEKVTPRTPASKTQRNEARRLNDTHRSGNEVSSDANQVRVPDSEGSRKLTGGRAGEIPGMSASPTLHAESAPDRSQNQHAEFSYVKN